MSQVDHIARELSGQSAHTMCERSWVRVPIGPCAFSSPVTFALLLAASQVPSRFGDESDLAGGNCHRSAVWLGSSVVRVLARCARGPGIESRSGHVLFPPL